MSVLDQIAAKAAATAEPETYQIRFLLDLNGPDPADPTKEILVYKQGQSGDAGVSLDRTGAQFMLDSGIAEPVCDASTQYCLKTWKKTPETLGAEILRRYERYQELLSGKLTK